MYNDGLGLYCAELTTYEKVSYVTQATFSLNNAAVRTFVKLSRLGDQPAAPVYLTGMAAEKSKDFVDWTTTEP